MFGRSKRTPEGSSAQSSSLQEMRRKQVTTLHTHHLAIRELDPDSTYEVTTTVEGNLTLQLTITLPPSFPESPPTIHVSPLVQHAWVDRSGFVVGHERLARWDGGRGVVLGKLVKEIVQEFTLRPPSRSLAQGPLSGSSGSSSPQHYQLRYQTPPPVTSNNHQQYQQPQFAPPQYTSSPLSASSSNPPSSSSHFPPPAASSSSSSIAADFPELDTLPLEAIEDMARNSIALDSYFEELEHVRNMRAVHADLVRNNEQLARRTLARESELNTLQSTLADQLALYRTQHQKFLETAHLREDAVTRFNPDYITSTLRALISRTDAECDALAASLVRGDGSSVEEFSRQYRELRKTYHLRAAKLERWERYGAADLGVS
ncbi:hypothetical protein DFS34DRAFT_682495 [Phlyctochytrium arcticum]|nr:hypothetical protein DFS34DRAFT_682495 [Phlyctochytrium arcticum]